MGFRQQSERSKRLSLLVAKWQAGSLNGETPEFTEEVGRLISSRLSRKYISRTQWKDLHQQTWFQLLNAVLPSYDPTRGAVSSLIYATVDKVCGWHMSQEVGRREVLRWDSELDDWDREELERLLDSGEPIDLPDL